ncbi:multidrug resistance-associated protein 1-like [Amphibalanus amphitrite]|uniref:multidrug resistance-associated protein 1-like n=1 Tax=Amphibalanus amphitrite TaxID=1232801 RepID=UPI001C918E39|nr:multidrug resistance-associated protein 1-like [Amphibalanus amphitrite]
MSGFEGYCHSEFWNAGSVWRTDDPDFTACFERTALVWAPCALLWLLAPVEIFLLKRSTENPLPRTILNVSKCVLAAVLLIVQLASLAVSAQRYHAGYSVRAVDVFTPIILFATIVLALLLTVLGRRRGVRTSGVLWTFWTVLLLCAVPEFRTRLRAAIGQTGPEQPVGPFVLYMVYFPVLFGEWLLSCFADTPTQQRGEKTGEEKPCPEGSASFLSQLTFAWFEPMALLGWRRSLRREDLWRLDTSHMCSTVVAEFNRHWHGLLHSTQNHSAPDGQKAVPNGIPLSGGNGPRRTRAPASVLPALVRTFGPRFLIGVLLKFVFDTLQFLNPQILSAIIGFVSDSSEPAWHGYFYAVLMVLVSVLMSLVLGQYFLLMMTLGMHVRTALMSAVYTKALTISNSARRESTVGEIVNLMSVDAQRFMDLVGYVCMIWSAPYQIGLAVYFLYQELGASVFVGIAIMVVLMPLQLYTSRLYEKLQLKQMKYKDMRVKMMNEILGGIKVLKLYAWEPSFEQHVLDIRDQEIRVLRKTAYLNAFNQFIWSCAPFMVCLGSFATYVLTETDGVLDSRRAFVSLALFSALRFPLAMLPFITASTVQARVSLKRMNKYLNSEDLDEHAVSHDDAESDPVVVEGGSFAWEATAPPTLQDVTLRVSRGSLAAVVGMVGAGKSSLLSALLGEMEKLTGRVNVKGSVAYVAQEAWIQNATLKDNILFGRTLDEDLYNRCVDACALRSDFDMLPAGDDTEIGEKGINLSGGQKQRVALARAVYSDRDVYLLDDPLSAVDSHVGKHIFENVIGPEGMLKDRTRVLVTHGIAHLSRADLIVVLRDGRVSETGPYRQLMDNRGAFSDFLLQYLTEAGAEDEEEELDEIKHQLEETLGRRELQRKMERVRQDSESRASQGEGSPRPVTASRSASVTSVEGAGSARRRRGGAHPHPHPEGDGGPPPAPPVGVTTEERDARGRLIEAEKTETGKVKLSVYGFYARAVGVLLTLATFLLYIAAEACSVSSNIWLSTWTEDETSFNDTDRRNVYLSVYGALGVGQALFAVSASFCLFTGLLSAARLMHSHLLSNVLRLSMAFFDTTPLGRTINRFGDDVDTLDNALPMVISDCIVCFCTVLGTLFAICFATPIFLAVVAPVLVVYNLARVVYVSTSRQLKRLESVSRSPIYSHFGETISGAATIRAFGKVPEFTLKSEELVDDNQTCYYPSMIANRWLASRLDMVTAIIIFFAAVFGVLARDTIEVGLVGMSISYAMVVTQEFNWFVRMTSDVETDIVAVERIKEYSETPQEAVWVDESRPRPPPEWPQSGRVQFNNYQTRYRPGLELVLKGIDADISGGEKIGIVGRTGAGKSSLTLALFRIIEAAAGDITLDGIRISDIGLHDLRSKITIIPQDPVLFSGTLRQNMDPFDQYSDDQVWAALEHSHLKTFVKGLDAGLQHEISEGGGNLSVGQRQLICLGRALLRKTKILVLDEATAAVDLETDDLIQATIRSEFADCTVLTIAHRLNTIMDSTRVMVLESGRIREMAPPSELLADKGSVFYGMARAAGLA